MKFWLVCFGLLFVGAELVQWFAELGSRQPAGAVLMLGGMGLAAVSNAAHLPKVKSPKVKSPKAKSPKVKSAEEDLSGNLSGNLSGSLSGATAANCAADQSEQSNPDPGLSETQPDRRSISFKVRFPFR